MQRGGMMKVVKVVAALVLLAACGRLGFDPTTMTSGDDDDGSGGHCTPEPAATLTIHAGDDLYGLLATLPAGSVVEVEAGTYTSPGNAPMTWTGTATQPVIVRAAPGTRPVLVNTPGNNGLDLYGRYFTLRGFELTGGDQGVRLGGVDHVALEDLYIHDVVDEGVTSNRPGQSSDSVRLRRIEIAGTSNAMTGTGITLGCSDQSCTVTNAVVEGCYVHDTGGSAGAGLSLWKHDAVAARDNVFVRTAGPGVVVQETATSARDTIERNLVWNPTDNGIQVEGEVIVRNNLVLGATSDGITSRQQSGSAPVDVTIIDNTIVAANTCIDGSNWTGSSYVVANNALQCMTNDLVLSGAPVMAANLDISAGDIGAVPDVYPTAGSLLIDAGDAPHSAADDFNGTPRPPAPDIGAYERTGATNPGWVPSEGMKPLASGCP